MSKCFHSNTKEPTKSKPNDNISTMEKVGHDYSEEEDDAIKREAFVIFNLLKKLKLFFF